MGAGARFGAPRWRRAARSIGVVLAGLTALVLALGLAADLLCNLPFARRAAMREVDRLLTPLFKGTITVERVGRLRLDGVADVDVRVQAADGSTVIAARGVCGRVAPWAIIASLLRRGELRIDVFDASVRSADVNLDTDESGVLKLQTALDLAHPSPVGAPAGRALRLDIAHLTVDHARVVGKMASAPPLDVDLDGVSGSVLVLPGSVRVDVDHVALTARAMPGGANPRGTIQGHMAVPTPGGAAIVADATFAGEVGGIPATATAALHGAHLDAELDVPEVAADRIRALAARAPVYQPASGHAEVHGQLESLRVTGRAAMGRGHADIDGTVALTGKLSGDVAVDVRTVDLHAFAPGAPDSSVDLDANVEWVTKADGLLYGSFALDWPRGGRVADESIPAASFRGDFEQRSGDAGFALETTGTVSEPGMPVAVHGDARTGPQGPVVHFIATSQIQHLADVRRVGGLGPGSASFRAEAVVTLSDAPAFEGALVAEALALRKGALHIDRARVVARGVGPLSAPTLSGTLDLSRAGRHLSAQVDQVRGGPGRLDVAGVVITGLGEPLHAALHVGPERLAFHADASGLDLEPLGYLLGIEDALREGRVVFAADLSGRPRDPKGTLVFDAENVCVANLSGLSGHLAASIEGRRLTGAMNVAAAGVGTLRMTKVDLALGGSWPPDAASLRRAWGSADVDGRADLSTLAGWLLPNTLSVARVSGDLALQGHIERRRDSDAMPDVTLALKTSHLALASPRATDEKGAPVVTQPRGWRTAGIDVELDASVTGPAGATRLGVRLADREGLLVSLESRSAALPYGLLLASADVAARRLMSVPFSAVLTVPSQPLARWPDFLRPEGARGRVQGSMAIGGTCIEPRIDARVSGQSLTLDHGPFLAPIDVDATAKYDGAMADVALDVRSSRQTILQTSVRLRAKVADFIASGGKVPSWNASAKTTMSHFPLESVATLADQHVRGAVSGRFEVTGLHEEARASANVDLEDLRVGSAGYGGGNVTIGFDGRTLDATLRLAPEAGLASVEMKVGMDWGARLSPSLDPAGRMDASLRAKHVRAALLGPFARSVVDKIDGMVDADVHVSRKPGQKPQMTGWASLRDGVIDLIALGQEFHAVDATASLTSDGVRLDDLSAAAATGRLTASGVAHIAGTGNVTVEGDLKIDKKDAMPLNVDGARLATVYGQLTLNATTARDREATRLEVTVPSLHIELPEASAHLVQPLDGPPSQIHVGFYASKGRFVVLPAQGATVAAAGGANENPHGNALTVQVNLGRDVEIRRGTDLQVMIDGAVRATLQQAPRVTGQIRLVGGKLDVQGRTFEITAGTVTFLGDPSNPMIKVTAEWTAEEGTRIFADYLGPLKSGKVTLRAEPARSQNEIVNLIVFGTADGSQSQVGTQTGSVLGGVATSSLSRGLVRLTGVDVTAKVDTQHANPRPELEVQIAKNISLELAVVLGTPPPGTNPDTTYATIGWRFLNSWSLETTFGNLGSSIADVVWRHRY